MPAAPFFFVGNLLWLDFVNTTPVLGGERVDLLADFAALVRWLQEAGGLSAARAREVTARWGESGEGGLALREVLALREALSAGAERLAAGKPPGDAMVRAVNRVLASRPAYVQLVREGTGFVSRVQPIASSAGHLLVPIAESAAWLLEHGDPSLVRRCEGAGCVLVFYDTTRNRSRRWCSMEGCGSRAKAAAYYRRTRRPTLDRRAD